MSRITKGFRIGKKILKYIFILLIVAINMILIWRVTSSSDPKTVKTITVNHAIAEEYNKNNGNIYMFTQDYLKMTYADYNYGYFGITQAVFIPDVNQAQVVLRYNNSTLRSVAADYGLASTPSRNEDLFEVTLLLAIDLTPENNEDNTGEDKDSVMYIRIHASESNSFTKNLYNYRRLVFAFGEDANIKQLIEDNLLLAVYADVYYTGADINYDERSYGTLCIYDYLSENNHVTLKNRDIKAIKKFEENN